MIDAALAILTGHPVLIALSLLGIGLLYSRYQDGLSRYPGDFLPSITSLGTLYQTWRDGTLPPYLHLHSRYGEVVRVGPRKLSFAQPQAIRDIYGTHGLNQKSEFHLAHQQIANGVAIRTLFASTDQKWHDSVRRCVTSAYSMTSMIQYEPFVDETIDIFVKQLAERFADREGKDGVVDFPRWLHFFTDDAITCVAYGSRLGHMEAGEDVEGLLAFGDVDSRWSILIGQAVWLELLGRRNPAFMWLQRRGWFCEKEVPLSVRFASKHQNERRQLLKEKSAGSDSDIATLTDKFIRASQAHPDVVGDSEVLAMGLSIVAAGSDTTAISLSAFFYHMLRHPDSHDRLVKEIDEALPTPNSTMSFAQAQKLPYLSACIKEAFRLHPATRYAPERVTPPQGHRIAGEYIPGNTVVFVSAWVIHHDKDVYGEDADDFRPARWLDSDPEQLKTMERLLSHFGSGGNNTCLGKNVALLEMYKVIPALLQKFRIEFADPKKEWSIQLGTFVSVADFNVRLRARDKAQKA